jgi:hypothetical protein
MLFQRLLTISLLMLCARARCAEIENEKLLQDILKNYYEVMTGDDAQAQLALMKSFRPTKADFETLKVADPEKAFEVSDKGWPFFEKNIDKYTAEVKRGGKLVSAKITRDERNVLKWGDEFPTYRATVMREKNSSGLSGFVFLNKRWLWLSFWFSPEFPPTPALLAPK